MTARQEMTRRQAEERQAGRQDQHAWVSAGELAVSQQPLWMTSWVAATPSSRGVAIWINVPPCDAVSQGKGSQPE